MIDELKLLWNNGVVTYNDHRKLNFWLRVALLRTINKFSNFHVHTTCNILSLSYWNMARSLVFSFIVIVSSCHLIILLQWKKIYFKKELSVTSQFLNYQVKTFWHSLFSFLISHLGQNALSRWFWISIKLIINNDLWWS